MKRDLEREEIAALHGGGRGGGGIELVELAMAELVDRNRLLKIQLTQATSTKTRTQKLKTKETEKSHKRAGGSSIEGGGGIVTGLAGIHHAYSQEQGIHGYSQAEGEWGSAVPVLSGTHLVYLLYRYKSTNTDASGWCRWWRRAEEVGGGSVLCGRGGWVCGGGVGGWVGNGGGGWDETYS
jgi:hypothetical protein